MGNAPRMVVPMDKAEGLQSPDFGWLLRRYGACLLRRGGSDVQAIRCAFRVLERAHVLFIAPEGMRGGDSRLQLGKAGTAYLARRTRCPWCL